ncbi:MAG: fimbrillin family protein [Muribaculaceae bacterium]|nr:fimbrillin family protein [Muribaculaceae bacterium]
MKYKISSYTGLLLLFALLLSSCSQEEPASRGVTAEDEILFYPAMPGVETRSEDIIDDETIKKGFYVSAVRLDSLDASGRPYIHFSDELVSLTPGMGNAFRSKNCRWPSNKGGKEGKLRFFAFYPSQKVLRDSAGLSGNTDYFGLTYKEIKNGNNVKYEYWMTNFKVNTDISRHSDFVTAIVEGSKTDNLYSGVKLTLQHELSRINLLAFGNSESYDVEIAGVRMGGIALESDFSFEDKPNRLPAWTWTQTGRWIDVDVKNKKGCVEYIFRDGDAVVSIGKGNHETESDAVSIMGNGGPAMVIPNDYPIWMNYSGGKYADTQPLYFSVLLRVKERLTENKTLLYPYIEGADMTSKVTTDNMNVVYLSVDTLSGIVKQRLYRNKGNKDDKNFYTDENYNKVYDKPVREEIRNYGWAAAIPLIWDQASNTYATTLRLNPGVEYTYRFNYSTGIGVEDPADVFPGKPIISPIEVTGTQAPWHTVNDYNNEVIADGDVNFTIE